MFLNNLQSTELELMTLPVHHVAVVSFIEFGKLGECVQHLFLKKGRVSTTKKRGKCAPLKEFQIISEML
jgi:hypothetical protein